MEQYVNELLKGFDIRNAYIKIYDLYKKTGCMYHVKNYNELKIIIIISANIFYGLDLNWLDVSDITDMHGLFSPYYDCNGEKCNYLVSEPLKKANLNISDWDLSHVTNMDDIDYGCDNFKI